MVNFEISYRIRQLANFLLALVLSLSVLNTNAQDFESEKDLQKKAEKLFNKEEYVEAFPLYSQLLSVYPDDITYNYKLSVCMLYADADKEKAIPYLQRVTSNLNANKKSHYYMGVAYHLNYQFNRAINSYERYLKSAPKKETQALKVRHKIQMCRNGLKLLTHKSEISVLKKTEIKETEYFRAYDMSLFGGKLLVKPDDFKSDADKEKGERSIIYLGKDANLLFYSSYGKLGLSKDIYLVIKRKDGDWGAPKILSSVINTEFDEEYPVMFPNSNVLYFCSKGHNSMGGYDIFKSVYDSSSNRWSKPVNLDFAINSADDDILYLTTPDEMTAYFSSKRSSIIGRINVYKVRLKKRPGEAPVIASSEEIISDDTGELINIEEIQELAQLDVNAKEEDFDESPEPTIKTTAPSVESKEIETFTDLSRDELIEAGKNYVEKIKKDQNILSNEAEVSFTIASDKKELSQQKINEAETILARVENITDPDQKQLALQKVDNLKKEAVQLERQSEIAFNMSKSLAADADVKQKELATAENNAISIESAAKNNQLDESISLLIEQKVLAQSGMDNKVGVEEMTRKMKQDADLKESMASESYEKIQFIESEIAEINEEIVNLKDQAESTKDPVIKEEILRQAEELEEEMKESEGELEQTYADARVFEKDAKELKEEAALFTAVSSEIMKTSKDRLEGFEELVAMSEAEPAPSTETESASSENARRESSEEAALDTTEPGVENEEETEPLVSIVTTDETGLETNEDNLTEEDLAKYDINEETVIEALTEEEVKTEILKVEELQKEAEDYTTEAVSIREKAETIENPEFKQNAIREAEKFESAAADKESEATIGQSSINYYSFQQNVSEFDEISSDNQYLSAQDINAANSQKEKSQELFEEARSIRKDARAIEDPQEKSAELEKADLLEREAISVQREGLNQLAVIENKEKLNEQKKMDSQMNDNDLAIINQLQTEADELYKESKQAREKANKIEDPEIKIAELNKATALEKKAIQKQRAALNNYEFQSNLTSLVEAYSSSEPLSTAKMTRLEKLQDEFNELLKESVEARVNSDDTASVIASAEFLEKAVDLEELALQKQLEVMRLYRTGTDQPVGEEVVSSHEELALNTTSDETSAKSTESATESELGPETMENTNISSTEPVAEMIEPEDPRSAEELIAASEQQKQEAKELYDRIEIIDDPVVLMEILDKAEELEKKANANMTLARKKQEALGIETDSSEELALNRTESTESAYAESTEQFEVTEPSSTSTNRRSSSQPLTESVEESYSTSTATDVEYETLDEASPEDIIAAIMAEEAEEFMGEESVIVYNDQANATTSSNEPGIAAERSDEFFEETVATETATEEETLSFAEMEEPVDAISIETFEESAYEPETAFEAGSNESPFNTPVLSTPLPATSEPLTEDIFTTVTMNTYTKSNPIPVNKAVPKGLIFKVQIGAFRNPIPQDLFKGISPIMGENTAMGFIRYTAGLFRKLASANKAKKVIRDYGFGDAFVVAFYDGNRISINEAQSILKGGEAPLYAIAGKMASVGESSSASSGETGTTTYNTSSVGESSSVSSGETGTTIYGTIDLSSIKELFYTVQVGVYKNPINLEDKYGLGLLNSINTSNGFIRYTYGIFDDINKATPAKRKMVNKGISDAFITAYYKGSRISMAKAKTYELSNEIRVSRVDAESEIDNYSEVDEPEELTPADAESGADQPGTVDAAEDTAPASSDLEPATEVFMVQIGQFNNTVSIDATVAFFSLKELGIERHEQDELIIYTVGSFNNYNDAEELRKVVASKGVAEGEVVINRNGRIIPMEDFLKNSIDNESPVETTPDLPVDKEPEPNVSDENTENSEPATDAAPDPDPPANVAPQSETETDTDNDGPLTDDEFERELQKILDDDL